MKGKEFLRRLQALGVKTEKGRGKGGHIRLIYQQAWTIMPTHGSADIDPNFLKKICKQLGIEYNDLF